MRITGGRARGVPLVVPSSSELRPTTDFLRTRIFNLLRNDLRDACVLDCFAGTGAYGLEALSRGASYVDFVEAKTSCREALALNIQKVCHAMDLPTDSCRVVGHNAFTPRQEVHTHIFFDPPYVFWNTHSQEMKLLVCALARTSPDAFLVVETPRPQESFFTDTPWLPVTTRPHVEIYSISKSRTLQWE
jgi:16S rRNA (guanine966-N2)-methyltransferase